jgi:probable HAF family extracellular repeat protein
MRTKSSRLNLGFLTTTLTGLALLSLGGGSALAAKWTITDLGVLGAGNGDDTVAWSINNLGQVVGRGRVLINTNSAARARVVMWANGVQVDLGQDASSSLTSAKINNAGLVAINDGNWQPRFWRAGVLAPLPMLAGGIYGGIHGLNSKGKIVGWSDSPIGGVSVIWQGGAVSSTGLPGGPDAWAVAINDLDALAVSRAARGHLSYILAGGSTNYLNVAGMTSDGYTAVKDLNNAGHSCGVYNFNVSQSAGTHAFLWTGGLVTPLPEYPAGGSDTVAMNNLGHVVGYAQRAPYDAPAVLWRDGAMTSLNELPEVLAAGWSSITARDINDQDQICGHGYHGGVLRAFLLSPVTAPSPFSLTIARSGTNVTVSFPTETGFNYQLQSAAALPATSWQNEGSPFPGTGGVLTTNFPLGPEPSKFFRLFQQ